MNRQYLADQHGNVTGVFIPIQEWDWIREQLQLADETPSLHRRELLEAVQHLNLIKQGKLPKPSLSQFLNELDER